MPSTRLTLLALAVPAALTAPTSAHECQDLLSSLGGRDDEEVAALCRARLPGDMCRGAREMLGQQPWSAEHMEATCARWQAEWAPRVLGAKGKHDQTVLKKLPPPIMDEATKFKSTTDTTSAKPAKTTTKEKDKGLLGHLFHKTTTEKPKGLLGHLFHHKDDKKEKKKGPFHFGSDRKLEKPMTEENVEDVMNEYFDKHQQVMAKMQAKPEERVLLDEGWSAESQCQGFLQMLDGRGDEEVAALCRARLPGDMCRSVRESLGQQPWSADRMTQTCVRWQADWAPRVLGFQGKNDQTALKKPPMDGAATPKKPAPGSTSMPPPSPQAKTSIFGGLFSHDQDDGKKEEKKGPFSGGLFQKKDDGKQEKKKGLFSGGLFQKKTTTTPKPKGVLGKLFGKKDDGKKEERKGPLSGLFKKETTTEKPKKRGFPFGPKRKLEKPMENEESVKDVMTSYFDSHQEVMDHMQGKWEADSVGGALRGISGSAMALFVGVAVAMAAGVMIVGRRIMYGQGDVRGVHLALLRTELEDGTEAQPTAE